MIPDVEFCEQKIAVCDDAALERVREAARNSPRLRARLCLHSDPSSQLHEMIIVLRRGTEIPIHRHVKKAECYHVMRGMLTLRIYHADGTVAANYPLGLPGTGRPFVCRIAEGLWHTVVVESEEAIVHESTIGPLSPGDTDYFPTSPI